MLETTIKVNISRFSPSDDMKPHIEAFDVPLQKGMSVVNVLDYVYENLDGSLAYFSHTACRHNTCGRCALLINGKVFLACQTKVFDDMTIEPLPRSKIIRDLVYL